MQVHETKHDIGSISEKGGNNFNKLFLIVVIFFFINQQYIWKSDHFSLVTWT